MSPCSLRSFGEHPRFCPVVDNARCIRPFGAIYTCVSHTINVNTVLILCYDYCSHFIVNLRTKCYVDLDCPFWNDIIHRNAHLETRRRYLVAEKLLEHDFGFVQRNQR